MDEGEGRREGHGVEAQSANLSSELLETCKAGGVHVEAAVDTCRGAHIVRNVRSFVLPVPVILLALLLAFAIFVFRFSELRFVYALYRGKIWEDVQNRGSKGGRRDDDGVYERLQLRVSLEERDKSEDMVAALELYLAEHREMAGTAEVAACKSEAA